MIQKTSIPLVSFPPTALIVHNLTWLTPLPSYNVEVQALLKTHNDRVIRRDYNPGAGLLPSSMNHGASRLKEFVSEESLGEFTGPTQLKLIPESVSREQLQQTLEDTANKAPVVFAVRDLSGSVTAMASESVRDKLREIVRDAYVWNDLLQPNKTFVVTLRSINWNNQRYFVLNGLQ